MPRVLQWLTILGVVLVAGGIWSAFDKRSYDGWSDSRASENWRDDSANSSRHRDARRPGAKPTGELWARPETLADHFARHGKDFNARDAQNYARMANEHLRRAYREGLPAKREDNGMLIVYDPRTRAFGAYNSDGTTRTFFKPDSPTYFDRKPGQRVDLRSASRP